MGKRWDVWLARAREHHRAGRLDGAAADYRRVLQVEHTHVGATIGLADVLESSHCNSEAIFLLEEALKRSPLAVLQARLGDAFHAQGELERAVEIYDKAVKRQQDLAGAWWGLGCAQASLGEHGDAVTSFRRLVAIQPDNGMALHNLGRSLFELGQVDPALESFRQSIGRLPDGADCLALGNIAVAIPGSPSSSNAVILEARCAWADRCLPVPSAERLARKATPHAGRRVRLGYISAFFDKRNWMKPVWGLINNHDRNRFEVHVFSDGAEASAVQGYRSHPRDNFHAITGLTNPALARRIEELDIDVLIDLNGYSRPSRLPLFALRPAPVQVGWFNMFATSGMRCFDYLIGDEHVIPRSEEDLYTERILRVPGSYLTFEVAYRVPEVTAPPALIRGALTFGCLASQYKITSEVVEVWCRILKLCPGTTLFLKNAALNKRSSRAFVVELFARFGVPADRLVLEGPAEHFTFLDRYSELDVALDTFPYNGGTTTTEALWQGVPVLTFAGDRWASRTSSSLLHEANLSEFVATDLAGYEAKAIALAQDEDFPRRLRDLRLTMRDRLGKASVCDVIAFARSMEDVYLQIMKEHADKHEACGDGP